MECDGSGVSERGVHPQIIRGPGKAKAEAIAVSCEGRTLTYGELNRRANRVAHYLRGQGVKADKLVGLCVERWVEMVVGILGILKAGGAMCHWIRGIRRSGWSTCWRTAGRRWC